MLVKEITFNDTFTGAQKTETHYFNMTRAEIIEYDAMFPEGAIAYLTRLVQLEDAGKLIQAFKDLILRSYGERTDDGRFIKSQDRRDAFMTTEAYSELFMEVTASEENMAAFVNGIVPRVPNAGKNTNVTPIPASLG